MIPREQDAMREGTNMPKKVQYTEQLKKLKETAIQYFGNNPTPEQMDQFLEELQSVQNANSIGFLTGADKEAYNDLVTTLKEPHDETAIHKAIKKRAIDAFTNMNGDLSSDAALEASRYSKLYEFISNEKRLKEERIEYERKNAAEGKYNQEIRSAIKAGSQEALDQAKAAREANGFTEIRNQLKNEGYGKGKIFKSCTDVFLYLGYNRKKENKTAEEQAQFNRIDRMKKSHLFVPYMKIVDNIHNDKEAILYSDATLQESMERLKESEEMIKRAKEAVKKEEKERKAADFAKHRDEHAADINAKFSRYIQIMDQLKELSAGRSTEYFNTMRDRGTTLYQNRWNDEKYKETCLYDTITDKYDKQIQNVLEKVDEYIQHKERQFFKGKIGKQRLDAARELKTVLTEMQTSMQNFKTYRKEHPQELGTLMDQMQEAKKIPSQKSMNKAAVAAPSQKIMNKVAAAAPFQLSRKPKIPALKLTEKQNVPAVKKAVTNQKSTNTKRKNSISAAPKRIRSNSVALKSPGIQKAEFKNSDKKKLAAHKAASVKRPVKKKAAAPQKQTGVKKAAASRKQTGVKKAKKPAGKLKQTKAQKAASDRKAKEHISFMKLRQEATLTKEDVKYHPKEAVELRSNLNLSKSDLDKNREKMKAVKEEVAKHRLKEAEDLKRNKKLKLDPPEMKQRPREL